MNTDLSTQPMAVLAIGRTALMELSAGICLRGTVEHIKAACKRDPYWSEFCRLVAAGQVPADFAGPGVISRCVIGWAREGQREAMGIAWWNGLTQPERKEVLRQAAQTLVREPSVADAWELWRSGRISTGK